MKKQSVESIATIVEGIFTMQRRIVQTRKNHIAFFSVNPDCNDIQNLTDFGGTLAQNAIKHGFSDIAALKKSFIRTSPVPDESFEVERPRFKLACLIYKDLNQCHLILFGK
jgi:hypothetical protein